jgi:hypothetical protein
MRHAEPTVLKRLALSLAVLLASAVAVSAATHAAPRDEAAEKTVASAFRAALGNDFQAYLAVVHPNEKANPQQVSQLEKYTFARFVRQAAWYLAGQDADSFKVERREELGGGKVKLFLKDLAHPSRAAVPVTLEQRGDAFLILSNSL